MLWDEPEVYGIALQADRLQDPQAATFNSKRKFHDALRRGHRQRPAPRHLIVSFNNEGYIDREQMVELLGSRGEVEVEEIPYARYVGAKIGIYNPSGKKVGKVSHTKNVEYLFHVRVSA